MILRFLRLFAAFRDLEADRDSQVLMLRQALQEEAQRALLLQDRLDAAQGSVSQLWGMVDSAQQRAHRAMEMQVNYAVQQRFGVTPYPEAQHLPQSAEPDLNLENVARRATPSERMAAMTNGTIQTIINSRKPA